MNSIQQLNEAIRRETAPLQEVMKETSRMIVGQERLINRMLIALLSNGHILIEGVPGLAKTLAVRTLAATINAKFQRIQFTPDLLPSDLIGTQIYNPRTGEFTPRTGPIFSNIILADEINRAPAKVQSALLEAMEERQVTLGDQTYPLSSPFMVLATQNPIEQEGTYPLPEAQLDRFMLKVIVSYPTRAEERMILERMAGEMPEFPAGIINPESVVHLRSVVNGIYVDEKIKDYVLNIIFATRDPASTGLKELRSLIEFGASPRATIFLLKAAKASALLRGRGYVTPEDVKQIAPDVLRHRLIVSFEAQAEDVAPDQIIEQILKSSGGSLMLTAETLRKIRRIELRTRKLVDDSFAGAYHAIFKGRGIEFDQVRPYEAGDDIRLIDWNVTARTGEPFVKQFVEERELTVLLLLDTSASCLFGSTKQQKRDAAVELAAVVAYAAIRNQDKVGLILFSDQVELYVPPRKGRNHTLRLIRDLLAAQPSHKGTDIALGLRMANRLLKHHAVILLLSDFLQPPETYATELSLVAQRHDFIAGVLSDPLEQSWPDVGLVSIQDAETGLEQWIDTASKVWRDQYQHQSRQFRSLVNETLSRANSDRIDLPSDGDYISALLAFFQRRMSRIRT